LDDVVKAASLLTELNHIQFVIIGEGVKKEALIDLSQQNELSNIRFLPFQPREEFSDMMAAADLNLVTLNAASASFSMPNKVFNIMASARPILSVTPPESEVSKLVQTWNCGVNVPVGQPEILAKTIKALSTEQDNLTTMGQNGRHALEEHFSRQNCIPRYEQTLRLARR
jgi:glycosyltransferase involved in cell wall biosynthesis